MKDEAFYNSMRIIYMKNKPVEQSLNEIKTYLFALRDCNAPEHYIETTKFLFRLTCAKLYRDI